MTSARHSDSAGVSAHLGIPLEEYDARIRTFVPMYEVMLDAVASVVDAVAGPEPVVLDLGIGTGALSARCLDVRPAAAIIGIDADPGILALARARLEVRRAPDLRAGSYLDLELPPCDLVVASISLHHVPDPGTKRALYARCRRALRAGGAMVLADCYLPADPELARRGMAEWRAFLERHYPPAEARGYLDAWSHEDTYFPLADELDWLRDAGFRPDVVWRSGLFAVLLCA